MWPLRRPEGERGRSRFTREPGRNWARLERSRVSGARSAEKQSLPKSVAVRHTPFTAMLAPSRRSSRTVAQRMVSRAPEARRSRADTVPNSSTIPVNIYVTFHCKFVRGDGMYGHTAHTDGIRATPPSDAARQRQGLQAAENLRSVIEKDAVH